MARLPIVVEDGVSLLMIWLYHMVENHNMTTVLRHGPHLVDAPAQLTTNGPHHSRCMVWSHVVFLLESAYLLFVLW